ncbi:ciliogenesis associated TTC17 interacting protein [Cricetulus griseus]
MWVRRGLEAEPGGSLSHHTGLEELLLFFPETLAIVSDTGEPQGELTIEVQKGKYKDNQGILTHCLMVHAFSRGFLDKSLCGSSLLGKVHLPAALHLPSMAPTPIHMSSVRTCTP